MGIMPAHDRSLIDGIQVSDAANAAAQMLALRYLAVFLSFKTRRSCRLLPLVLRYLVQACPLHYPKNTASPVVLAHHIPVQSAPAIS